MTDPADGAGPLLLGGLWPRLTEWLAGRSSGPDRLDWALAAACYLAFTLPVLPGAGPRQAAGAAAFGVAAAAPLLVRRRWPVPVLLTVTAVYVTAALAGVAFTPFISSAGPNLAIAAFTVGDRCRRPVSLTAAGVTAVASWALIRVALQLHPEHGQDAVALVAVVAGWTAGDVVRAVRGYRRQVQLLQHRRAVEELRLAQAEERLRLSREVHDIVSHSLSAIAVQAGVARLVLDSQPGQAGTALAAIETASRSALDELRKLLRQIRAPGEAAAVATPTLADLPALIGQLRAAGLQVSCRTTGRPRPYPAAVEFSAYRIVQEALTNVTKHATGARARVEIGHGAGALSVTVANDSGPRLVRPAVAGGLGITGMRERAELLGGTLSAAPGPGGGFIVTAQLPAGEGTGPSELAG